MALGVDLIVFNDHINYGYTTRQRFVVDVLTSKTNVETRIGLAQASQKIWTFDDDADVVEAKSMDDFFLGRRGSLYGFLWKDWLDYTITDYDVENDGVDTTYQLYRIYDDTIRPYARKILYPKLSTVVVKLDNVVYADTNYTVGEETGIITLDAPVAGVITVSCEFYYPVRLKDEGWEMSHKDFDMVDVRGLVFVELVDEEV